MKEKSQPKNQDFKSNFTGSNLILNSIILLLGLLIIFLTFSLFNRLYNNSSEEKGENKKAASSVIQVEVLNGCGTAGIAEKFTDYLRKEKFDVVQMGNYISFDIDKSLVIDRTGNRANAEKVATALGVDNQNIIMQKNDDSFLDVSVVIGKDYKKLNQ